MNCSITSMKKSSSYISILILLSLLSGKTAAFDEEYSIPGDLYLMFQQFRMYIDCKGNGEIPIIIEPGIGDTLANWLPIHEELSQHTQVCVYDRAGMGLSDPGPGPRTASQIATELYYLLKKAKIDGPYILIGHSFGGYVTQYFAQVLPQLTAGLVLVESSHPEQVERLAELDSPDVMPKQSVGGYKFEDTTKLSIEQRYWKHLNAQRKSVWSQMDELGSFKESAEEVVKVSDKTLTIPVAVLSRGLSQLPVLEGTNSLEDEWQTMQKELTDISNTSWQVIVENSGHSIHQEAPESVIENSLKVLELARKN